MGAVHRNVQKAHPIQIYFQNSHIRPHSSGHTGRIALAHESESVRQSLLILLTTMPGERVMREGWGCNLFRLAFAPNDDTTAGLAMHHVRKAIERNPKDANSTSDLV